MKITFKTYLNDRLNQVDFHGVFTFPLYVQLTYKRKTIFFKSYYFELFSKDRYFLKVPGVGSKGPDLEQVIEKENELIDFIIAKHKDDFSLDLFKQAYAYYSKDLCDLAEKEFINYLHTFFWDEGMPALGDIFKHGSKNVIAYDAVRDMKRSFNKPLYEKLLENSFYYAPPYLPIYGFMAQFKRWPMLCLTVMEWERPETQTAFRAYTALYYANMPADELVIQVNKWAGSPVK
jgi:hypothetical protein